MTRYVFNKASNAMALLLELQAAGVRVGSVTARDATTEVDLEPEDFDAAATVVAAHDKAAADAADQALRDQDSGDLAKVRAAYQTLRSNADALRADAATLTAMTTAITAAQTKARLIQIELALADVSDAAASEARYVGRKLG